jgi:AcrR family transcriptional regulator
MTTTLSDLDPRLARSRTRMLAAASALLVEHGLRGVTVDAVAERSGVAKSTMYRHWSSIHELLIDVMRTNVPQAPDVDLDAGFEPALRCWIERAIESLAAPDWIRSLPALLELRTQSPEMAALLAADFDNKLSTVAAILECGANEGRLPTGLDARQVTHTLIGPLVLAALTGDEAQLAQLAGYVVDRFLASYSDPSPGDSR